MLQAIYQEIEYLLDEKTKEEYRYFMEEADRNLATVQSQLKDIQATIMTGTRQRKEYLPQLPTITPVT
jgi:hypothetical protein